VYFKSEARLVLRAVGCLFALQGLSHAVLARWNALTRMLEVHYVSQAKTVMCEDSEVRRPEVCGVSVVSGIVSYWVGAGECTRFFRLRAGAQPLCL
jgi:hypothetical protein